MDWCFTEKEGTTTEDEEKKAGRVKEMMTWPVKMRTLTERDARGRDIPVAAELTYASGLRETVTIERANELLRMMKEKEILNRAANKPVAANPKNQALLDLFAQDVVDDIARGVVNAFAVDEAKQFDESARKDVANGWWRSYVAGAPAANQVSTVLPGGAWFATNRSSPEPPPKAKPVTITPVDINKKRKITVEDA